MRNVTESELLQIACDVRTAISKAVQEGEMIEMHQFPTGCCAYASNLLQRYFAEKGIHTYYISGTNGFGQLGESHAWLETEDGTVIDITGDQYKNKKLQFEDPVYVGVRENGFHDKFVLDEPVLYYWDEDCFGVHNKDEIRYNCLLKYLPQEKR